MKNLLMIEGFPDKIGFTDFSEKSVNHAIRIYCSRTKKLLIKELEEHVNAKFNRCGFCNREVKRYQFKFEVISEQIIENLTARKEHNRYAKVTTIRLLKASPVDDLLYCKQSMCPGKKLNPNSIEFVKASRGMTEAEALQFIHSRNQSPFYRENHQSPEEYSNYQNIVQRLKSTHDLQAIIEKQNHARSLIGNQERYGKEEGSKRWKLIQSQKKITVENLSRIYGELKAAEIVLNWKSATRNTLENFMRRYGAEGAVKHQAYLEKICHNFGGKNIKEDEHEFYSRMELEFYRCLKKHNFTWKFLLDQRYPGSLMRSDFYFPMVDTHVEIAGGWFFYGYAEKMQLKETLFNPIIVKSVKEYDIIITDLIERHQHEERTRSQNTATGKH